MKVVRPRHQQGVALIMVIIVVAIITVAVAGMASRQQLDIRRSGNIFDLDKAYLLTLGAEDFARAVLIQDGIDSEIEKLSEPWAQETPPFPVGDGVLVGRLEDMQGRFNVNNLIDANGEVDQIALKRFERLLALVGLERTLAQAVLDWIDGDSEARFPDGAEDDYYMQQTPGYSAANRPLVSPSELVLVKGIGYKGYQALAPYVAALPQGVGIDVNTAPALVIAALVEGFSEEDAKMVVEERGEEGVDGVEDFLALSSLAGATIDEAGLTVASSYFLLSASADWGRGRARLFSLLWRDSNNKVITMMRGQGAY